MGILPAVSARGSVMDGVSDKKCNKNICLLHIHHAVPYVFGQVVPISSKTVPWANTGHVSTLA